MRLQIFSFLGLALLAAGLPAQAATINVPADHATINAAVAAAGTSDTIVINNSATYSEALILSKKVTITAAVGMTPTISSATTTPLQLDPGSEGTRIGSLAGGRITISGIGQSTVITRTTGSTEVVLENLTLESTATAGDIISVMGAGGSRTSVSHCTMDGKNLTLRGYMSRWLPAPHTGWMKFDHVRLQNIVQFPFWNYSGASAAGWPVTPIPVDVEVKFCELDGSSAYVAARSNYSTMLLNRNTRPNLTMQDSLVIGTKGCLDMFWNPAGTYDHADAAPTAVSVIERTVFLQPALPAGATDATYDVIRLGQHSGWDVTIDHCDIVAPDTTFPRPAVNMQPIVGTHVNPTQTHRSTTIKSTNIYTAGTGITVALTAGAANDKFVSDYNNVFSTGAAYTGATPGVNDVNPGVDPGYSNAAPGDVRYSNNSLKRAGEGNTAVGVNASYVDVLAGIIVGTPAVNRAAHWSIMN